MTDDNPKVGNIIVVDAETIARVMKVEPDQIVVHALDFPFFRIIAVNNYDISTIKVADNTHKALTQLVLPTLAKNWSLESWESEVDDIVEYVLDDIEDEFDTVTVDSPTFIKYTKNRCRYYARQSDWFIDPEGQEKCIKYSVNYLEIEPDEIIEICPEKERHMWTSVRKAAALVHLSRDVYAQVLDSILENDDDYDDDDEYDE